MRVLIPDVYLMDFNIPTAEFHPISRKKFFPLSRIWRPLTAISAYSPWLQHDLVHVMNGVPLYSSKPWVVTFESMLPRSFKGQDHWVTCFARNRLLDRRCRAIIAMSQWAARIFCARNRGWDGLAVAKGKLIVLHPSVPLRSRSPKRLRQGEAIKITFVGNDFARKGGIVALRLARAAAKYGLRVNINIFSAMQYGRGHTDYLDPKRYEEDLKSLNLTNVRLYGHCDNSVVLASLNEAHLSFLPTLHDTYGFSLLEGYSYGTPSVNTNVCAQRELNPGDCGFILNLPTTELNIWTGIEAWERKDAGYWELVSSTYDELTRQALTCITRLTENPQLLEELSYSALMRVRQNHDPERAARVLSDLYARGAGQQRPTAEAMDLVHRRGAGM